MWCSFANAGKMTIVGLIHLVISHPCNSVVTPNILNPSYIGIVTSDGHKSKQGC